MIFLVYIGIMNKPDFMPKKACQRILSLNIRLINLALLETDETAPTLTLAAKAQKLLFSLFYLRP